ncbi:hypothetical protein V2J09_009401 [Rumex salicifolius]
MFVAEIGLYGPRLSHLPNSFTSNSEFKTQLFIPNRVCTKSKSPSQFLPKRTFIYTVVRTMNGDGCEDNDNGEAELSGAFEQEEQNPLYGGSTAATNGLHSTVNRLVSRFSCLARWSVIQNSCLMIEIEINKSKLKPKVAFCDQCLCWLSKWLVAVLFTATVLGRHDAEALWAAMGSVLNSAFSVVLKHILNQERPNSAISSGPGMPSSHAQSIFYTVVFSWLRVSQQYHTTSQVAVGAAVGSAFGILWLWSWQAFVVRAFASFLWVRLVVIVASLVSCLCFVVHIVRDWLRDVQ